MAKIHHEKDADLSAIKGRTVAVIGEHQSGGKNFQRLREADASHPVEKVGAELRKMMPLIK